MQIIVFGVGALGLQSASILREEISIAAFCDNAPEKQGQEIGGLPCVSPAQLADYPNPFVLIAASRYYSEIHKQLQQMGIPHCALDAYVVYRHFEEVEEAYYALDHSSRDIYAAILLYRMTGERELAENCYMDHQYFSPARFRYLADPRGVFVDCGAYVGDTVDAFIQHAQGIFGKIYAFEPYDRSFEALRKRVNLLKEIWALSEDQIICEPYGVGACTQMMEIADQDRIASSVVLTNSVQAHGNPLVQMVSLDSYMLAHPQERVTFLKADIEGAETDLLCGAAQTIQKDKPRIAICIYHSIYDFFRIPLTVRRLVPEYRLEVRHHSLYEPETVLYCSV